ncbi:hypothetical protein ACJX0J_017800, partial [Zea mays]
MCYTLTKIDDAHTAFTSFYLHKGFILAVVNSKLMAYFLQEQIAKVFPTKFSSAVSLDQNQELKETILATILMEGDIYSWLIPIKSHYYLYILMGRTRSSTHVHPLKRPHVLNEEDNL